jgi:8-oxo-dGTP pyrophosphatase MutT (NUDIX family)
MDTLQSPLPIALKSTIVLSCVQTGDNHLSITSSGGHENIDEDLLDVLKRVFVQWNANQISSDDNKWFVSGVSNQEIFVDDLASEEGVGKLFSDIWDESSSFEWVEMVTGTGDVLGKVPRPLVHSFNLLHRGIGLFVTKDRPMGLSSGDKFPSLYTHRRSATKRIFPSLYDMFVGGVSLADEEPELTARREVAEELGLSRAITDLSALSDPILTCVVCTAYNRCVVTLFSYAMNTQEETVAWQEEEVDWGNFVPYEIIVAAADRSIQRFANGKTWPGTYPPIQSALKGSKPEDVSYESEDWTEWDFVPDGLLVWEAWLKKLDASPSV